MPGVPRINSHKIALSCSDAIYTLRLYRDVQIFSSQLLNGIVDPTEKSINVLEWSEKGYVSILDVTAGFEGKIPPFDALTLKANVLFGEEE